MSAPARPEGVRFWVAGDVVAWIAANADWASAGHDSPEEAAIWWLSVYLAEDFFSDLSGRERAEILRDGVSPVTLDDISEHLQDMHDHTNPNPEPTHAEVDADIEQDLKGFWTGGGR